MELKASSSRLRCRAGGRRRWLWAGYIIISIIIGIGLVIAVLALVAAQPVQAQSGGGRDLSWWVVSGGGGRGTSAHFVLESALGQPAAGYSASASYKLGSGFMAPLDQPSIYLPIVTRS